MNVDLGKDYTLFATAEGFVKFEIEERAPSWSAFILRRNHESQNSSEVLSRSADHLRLRQHLHHRRDRRRAQGRHLLACHPFYTGEQRIVDTAGQVDRFMKRLERTADTVEQIKRAAGSPEARPAAAAAGQAPRRRVTLETGS